MSNKLERILYGATIVAATGLTAWFGAAFIEWLTRQFS